MPATPKKGPSLGKDSTHQNLMLANLFACMIESGGIETTLTKAKVLRPVAEKYITKAAKGGVHNQRVTMKFLRDKDASFKLFSEIGPRYADRPGGYLRILKLGTRHGDNAEMARIEFVEA